MAVDVTADHDEKFFEIAKHAATQLVLVKSRKKRSTVVSHDGSRGRDFHVEAWMPLEPALRLGIFLRGIVILSFSAAHSASS
jgi:hypothetical protein